MTWINIACCLSALGDVPTSEEISNAHLGFHDFDDEFASQPGKPGLRHMARVSYGPWAYRAYRIAIACKGATMAIPAIANIPATPNAWPPRAALSPIAGSIPTTRSPANGAATIDPEILSGQFVNRIGRRGTRMYVIMCSWSYAVSAGPAGATSAICGSSGGVFPSDRATDDKDFCQRSGVNMVAGGEMTCPIPSFRRLEIDPEIAPARPKSHQVFIS